jgi:hypothetical protein
VVLKYLAVLDVTELKTLKTKLITLEDKIFEAYEPEKLYCPRTRLNFDDAYLRLCAKEALEAMPENYRWALRYYEAALSVNPYEGDNFAGCALMWLYIGDLDKVFYYVNEGLYVDPEHKGLDELAAILNEQAGEAE